MYNILIIDDETLIRQSLVKKASKYSIAFDSIESASNEREVMELIENKAFDIIISDVRLEQANGLDLLTYIRSKTKETQFIVISGHSQFSYAKTALELGTTQYLLKPINTAEFFGALDKCVENLNMQKDIETHILQTKQKENETSLQKKFLEDIKLKYFSIDGYLSGYVDDDFKVLVVCFYAPNRKLNPSKLDFKKNYKGENPFNAFPISNEEELLIFGIRKENEDIDIEMVFDFLSDIEDTLLESKMYDYTLGVSYACSSFYKAYKQALIAMQSRVLVNNPSIISFANAQEYIKDFSLSSSQKAHYTVLINNSSYKAIFDFHTKLRDEIKSIKKVNYTSIQLLFNFLLDTILSEYPEFLIGDKLVRDAYNFTSIESMFSYLNNLCMSAIESTQMIEEKDWSLVMVESVKYAIDNNYFDELSLDTFARAHNVSSGFLSRCFSETFNISYQDYLSSVRIEHAKQLLLSGKYKINEVATLCGFSNQHYFSRAFKKATGLSPSDFKQTT